MSIMITRVSDEIIMIIIIIMIMITSSSSVMIPIMKICRRENDDYEVVIVVSKL